MSDQTITRDTMFEPMLMADPTFAPYWAEFVHDWKSECGPPLYLALSSLARHLLRRLSNGDTDGFERVFSVVEAWHTMGDAYVTEAATVGFLEDLQNLSGGSDRRCVTVEPWLGPVSRRRWNTLDEFWNGETGALGCD